MFILFPSAMETPLGAGTRGSTSCFSSPWRLWAPPPRKVTAAAPDSCFTDEKSPPVQVTTGWIRPKTKQQTCLFKDEEPTAKMCFPLYLLRATDRAPWDTVSGDMGQCGEGTLAALRSGHDSVQPWMEPEAAVQERTADQLLEWAAGPGGQQMGRTWDLGPGTWDLKPGTQGKSEGQFLELLFLTDLTEHSSLWGPCRTPRPEAMTLQTSALKLIRAWSIFIGAFWGP